MSQTPHNQLLNAPIDSRWYMDLRPETLQSKTCYEGDRMVDYESLVGLLQNLVGELEVLRAEVERLKDRVDDLQGVHSLGL